MKHISADIILLSSITLMVHALLQYDSIGVASAL